MSIYYFFFFNSSHYKNNNNNKIIIYSDRELLRRAGPDGLLYVTFERHLIVLTFMMMVVALCVALPINYSGTMRRDSNETFSLTTLSNVDARSNWMWVYTIIVMSYLPIGSFVMRRFMKQVNFFKNFTLYSRAHQIRQCFHLLIN